MNFARTVRSCFGPTLSATLLCVALSACAGGSGTQSLPQTQQSTNANSPTQQTPLTSAAAVSNFRYHLFPVHHTAGASAKSQYVTHYPADVQYFGGQVVTSALSHDVYVDCTASCWGNPQLFLDNLNDSTFIHLVDQYVHATTNYRYRFGDNYTASVKPASNNLITDDQIANVVHLAALRLGGGYHNIYHVFLPPGIDTCIGGTSNCYAPDQPENWTFCAYHSSVDFNDKAGHVLYTVIPNQNVFGCAITDGPNDPVMDSTDSTLSHEYIETITDPDPDSAWFNPNFNGEVADLCELYDDVDFLYEHNYKIQEEYSNKIHGCTN